MPILIDLAKGEARKKAQARLNQLEALKSIKCEGNKS